MAHEISIQAVVHKLEEGGWVKWVRLGLIAAIVIYISFCWLFKDNGFKGLTEPRAFEQAEIARELARGHGFTTKIIRPAELWLIQQNKGSYPVDRIPDTYHGPVWPYVLAPFVSLGKNSWEMTTKDVQYSSDKIIVSVCLFFFILSLIVSYFTACRLFDHRLGYFGVWMIIICTIFWRYSMSGLPQMFMLFLFSCAGYCLVRMVEAREGQAQAERLAAAEAGEGIYEEDQEDQEFEDEPKAGSEIAKTAEGVESSGEGEGEESPESAEPNAAADSNPTTGGSPLPWAAGVALCFGLLALTHGMMFWTFAGLLLFCAIYFKRIQRWLVLAIMLGIVAACYAPWMVRNQTACGNPFGVSWYTGLASIRGTESSIMRSIDPPLSGVQPETFRVKITEGFIHQFEDIYKHLGSNIAAPVFFLALLHPFKRRSTRIFRFCLLSMWIFAVIGMAVWGLDFRPLPANDLHILFAPLMTFYGFAFLLVLWTRLDITVRLARIAFINGLYVISSIPYLAMLKDLHSPAGNRVEWPPYVPPYIALLGTWTNEREIIMSDMPWAVAWYADRKTLWLPMDVKDFLEFNDYDKLKGRIVGLYLTPVTGDLPFLSEIVKGEYKDWAPFITRTVNLRNFPLKAFTQLPIDNQCIFYADRDRWTVRED